LTVVQIHLIDGTYELYRQHFGQAIHGRIPPPLAGTIGVLKSTIQLLEAGATHVGVATDHVIESFRNDLYDGYKTSEGMDPVLLDQIPVLEDALDALGVVVWPMEEFEADDAIASAVRVACEDRRVHKVLMYSPDKDLAQCVQGKRVVQVDRKNKSEIDEAAVLASSAFHLSRFPTISPSWGTPPTASPGSRVGGRNRRVRCSLSTATWSPSRAMQRRGNTTASSCEAPKNW
jgi:hypothetical protein